MTKRSRYYERRVSDPVCCRFWYLLRAKKSKKAKQKFPTSIPDLFIWECQLGQLVENLAGGGFCCCCSMQKHFFLSLKFSNEFGSNLIILNPMDCICSNAFRNHFLIVHLKRQKVYHHSNPLYCTQCYSSLRIFCIMKYNFFSAMFLCK